MDGSVGCGNPDAGLARQLIQTQVERDLGQIPAKFRNVFGMRETEGWAGSGCEPAADALGSFHAEIPRL